MLPGGSALFFRGWGRVCVCFFFGVCVYTQWEGFSEGGGCFGTHSLVEHPPTASDPSPHNHSPTGMPCKPAFRPVGLRQWEPWDSAWTGSSHRRFNPRVMVSPTGVHRHRSLNGGGSFSGRRSAPGCGRWGSNQRLLRSAAGSCATELPLVAMILRCARNGRRQNTTAVDHSHRS